MSNRSSSHRRSRGFTLIEVLVASSVSLLLGLLVVGIFISSKRAVEASSGTLEMISVTRPAMARLSSLLTSAVTLNGEDDTIVYPPVGSGYATETGDVPVREEPATWTRYLIFRTTEDFLDPNFDPNEIWDIVEEGIDTKNHNDRMDTFDDDDYDVWDYIVWFDEGTGPLDQLPNEDKVLAVARLTQEETFDAAGERHINLRPSDDYRIDLGNDPFALRDVAVEPRIIGRGLESVSFHMLVPNGVYVSCLAQRNVITAQGGTMAREFRSEAMIQIPSIAMQQ